MTSLFLGNNAIRKTNEFASQRGRKSAALTVFRFAQQNTGKIVKTSGRKSGNPIKTQVTFNKCGFIDTMFYLH